MGTAFSTISIGNSTGPAQDASAGPSAPTQIYYGTTNSGESRTHMGNVYNNGPTNVYHGSEDHKDASNRKAIKECISALFLTDPAIDRATLISTKGDRAIGTCEWTKANALYQAWLRGDEPLLWISGDPGKGKTMLSIFLTTELEATERDLSLVLYYFCRNDDEKRNNAAAVLRGILWHILKKSPQLANHILQYFETSDRGRSSLSSQETLWVMLTEILHDPERMNTICIIDGLDECDKASQMWLATKFQNLMIPKQGASRPPLFHLAILSRDMPGLERSPQLKLNPDHNTEIKSDIELFVTERVADLSLRIDFDDDFRRYIEDELLQRAQGTFLWVGFAMVELLQKTTCSEVEEVLQGLPAGLPALYRRMLLQITSRHGNVCADILRWVTLALRPLTVRELAAALSVQAVGKSGAERVMRDRIKLCRPLVVVEKEVVSLVHQSARDFLLTQDADSNDVIERFRICPEEAHMDLAWTCLDIIHQSEKLRQRRQRLDDDDVLRRPLLLNYALFAWPGHTTSSNRCFAELLKHPSGFFLRDSELRNIWVSGYRSSRRDLAAPTSALHLACYLGVLPWVTHYMREESQQHEIANVLNERDDKGRKPLSYAAEQGNGALVRLLIDHGADLKDGALHIAASKGHEGVVQQLLESGVDVDTKDGYLQTALYLAVQKGYKNLVLQLLDHESNIEMQNGHDRHSALFIAAQYDDIDMMQLLLDRGANIEAKDRGGNSPLYAAACCGKLKAVRFLLDHGADPNAGNVARLIAPGGGSFRGRKATVQLINEHINREAAAEPMDLS